jgi:hypothetical protein
MQQGVFYIKNHWFDSMLHDAAEECFDFPPHFAADRFFLRINIQS